VLAVLAAIAGWMRPPVERLVARFTVPLPEGRSLGDSEQSRVAVSPDGRLLVYEVATTGGDALYLRRRDALDAVAIAGTQGAFNPFFSPDGSRLGFVVASTPRALRVMPTAGGPAVTLTDSLVDSGGASWGHDGFVYYDGHLDGDGIARVRETGGAPEVVTRADSAEGELWHFQPEALPNGKGLLFTVSRRFRGLDGEWWIGASEIGSGRHRRLVQGRLPRFADGHLLYVTDGGVLMAVPFDPDRLELRGEPVAIAEGVGARFLGQADLSLSTEGTLAYTTGASGSSVSELAWVSREGRLSAVDPAFRRPIFRSEPSPDGRRVAMTLSEEERIDVWVKDLDTGPAVRLTFDDARHGALKWSPDGRELYFTGRTPGASSSLQRAPADGSALPTKLRADPRAEYLVTRDRTTDFVEAEGKLYFAAATGDTATRLLVDERGEQALVGLSPNGRWLAYVSSESETFPLYVRPFPDAHAAKRAVTTVGVRWAGWSPRGDEMAYLTESGDFVVVPVGPGVVPALGTPRLLFNWTAVGLPPWLDIDYSHDGRRFLVVVESVGRSVRGVRDEIVVVENVFEELRAKRP
jgi:Tol biopolymer transport system component